MKRVLCISDSLGLPRPNVKYEDTWFYKISKLIPTMDFVAYFRRNATTNILSCDGHYDDTLYNYDPQVIILQLGICDCAPRYIRTTSILYKLLRVLPNFISKPVWFIIKKVRKRSTTCTDVSKERFRENLVRYIETCQDFGVEVIIFIKIAIPGDVMLSANPKVLETITLYNNIYDELSSKYSIVNVINPIKEKDNTLFVEDGYHINANGHNKVVDELVNIL